MKPLSAILAGLASALFLVASAADQVGDVVEEKSTKSHPTRRPEDDALATAQPLLAEAERLAASI